MAKKIETKKESKYMKKTITIIGKVLLKAAMFLAGFLAFIYVVGEPTEEWYAWARSWFGSLWWLWEITEKLLAMGLIAGLFKLYERMEPEAFKTDAEPKAVEE